jgi:hypothetical protein
MTFTKENAVVSVLLSLAFVAILAMPYAEQYRRWGDNRQAQVVAETMTDYLNSRDAFIGGAVVRYAGVREADCMFRSLYSRWYPGAWRQIRDAFPPCSR